MIVQLFAAAMTVKSVLGQTVVQQVAYLKDEVAFVRDDVQALCYKIHGGQGKQCRDVIAADKQRHIFNDCWLSGWSGKGKLRCKYGMDVYGENKMLPGDQEVARGANEGRRRLESDGAFNYEEEEMGAGSGAGARKDVVEGHMFFALENLEDEESKVVLQDGKEGTYDVSNSECLLMGTEVIEAGDDVRSTCIVKPDESGRWTLTHVSAKCHVWCRPSGLRTF